MALVLTAVATGVIGLGTGWLVRILAGRARTRVPVIELACAVGFSIVTLWWMGGRGDAASWFALAALLYLVAITLLLGLIDIAVHRLPNPIVLTSYPVAAVLLSVASLLGRDGEALLRAAVGMVVLYLFYALLRLVRPDGMGGGDVKLAGVLGLYLGWSGWSSLAVGAFAAFLLGGVFGIALMVGRRADRRTAIPFGPFMLAGAWVGLMAGPTIGRWYLGL
ncbi:prepilin peptidase [Microbacterium luticocti]|uniref:prepilin peptidase n=1 Tax=Microbacterium luticocti TaxID=451764 RepID=UPI00146E87C6|nr:A24 family peptidase [Microbacterium luticocti]